MTHAAMSRIAVESSAEARNNRSRSLKRAARTNASLTLVRRLTVFAGILTAMFILMRVEHIDCLIQPYQPEVVSSGCASRGCAHGGCASGGCARDHAHDARLGGKFFIAGALVPDLELIMTFRHIIDCHDAFLITGGKVRGRDRDYNCAHPGVNVAEDVRDPDPVEDDRARFTTGVQAQVKPLSFVQRKDVVEERVEVREIYFSAAFDGHYVRLKTFADLENLLWRPRPARTVAVNRFQPDHRATRIDFAVTRLYSRVEQFDLGRDFDLGVSFDRVARDGW